MGSAEARPPNAPALFSRRTRNYAARIPFHCCCCCSLPPGPLPPANRKRPEWASDGIAWRSEEEEREEVRLSSQNLCVLSPPSPHPPFSIFLSDSHQNSTTSCASLHFTLDSNSDLIFVLADLQEVINISIFSVPHAVHRFSVPGLMLHIINQLKMCDVL